MTPREREEEDSCPYPVGNRLGVLTTKWSADTKYIGLYLLRDRMSFFSGTLVCLLVPIDFLFDFTNKHEVHAVTVRFEVDLN